MKYKLFHKDFQMWKNQIAFLPSINLHINMPELMCKNFAITFHFLVWHGRLWFVEEGADV